MMQDIARPVAIPGKIVLAVWEVTGGGDYPVCFGKRSAGGKEVTEGRMKHKTTRRFREVDIANHDGEVSKMALGNDIVESTVESEGHLKANKQDDAVVCTEMWQHVLVQGLRHA
jgi:hypothetical protein